MMRLKTVRIGLWDQYGGSMPSGWTRWILEQCGSRSRSCSRRRSMPAISMRSRRAGRSSTAGIPERDGGGVADSAHSRRATRIPAEFRGWLGRVSVAKTVPEIKKFVENGGTVADDRIVHGRLVTISACRFRGRARGNASAAPRVHCRARSSTCPARFSRRASTTRKPACVRHGRRTMVFYDESPAFRLRA